MVLELGSRLGNYEILEPLGAGGMGEVYRARDTKLGRDVAIKVLSEEFSRDKERLERFEREAKLLAALNHPNIATLYGFEEHDGQKFLVMELVEGITLAERIAEGPVPIEEAIPMAFQIAEGLEAAHEKGIVHRDLKPANIKITADGNIRILDFGLAKAFAEDASQPEPATSMSPTMTRGATRVGVILGTAAYMSPEQAKGKPVDKRADIFAFGAVLFEMLTGKKAFPGESASDVLAAVIKSEPNWRDLPSTLAPRQRELLRRCVEKDPRQRWRDIGDVRLELNAPRESREPGEDDARGAGAFATRWILVLAAAFVASAFTALAFWWLRPQTEPPSVRRFTIPVEGGGRFLNIAISPTGDRVAVAEGGTGSKIWVRSLNRLDIEEVPGSNESFSQFFSQDGARLGFFAAGSALRIYTFKDRTSEAVSTTSELSLGATWAPDGSIVYAEQTGILRRVRTAGAEPEVVLAQEGLRAFWPRLLPDGKNALVALFKTDTVADPSVGLVNLETGDARSLIPHGTSNRAISFSPEARISSRFASTQTRFWSRARPYVYWMASATTLLFMVRRSTSRRTACLSTSRLNLN